MYHKTIKARKFQLVSPTHESPSLSHTVDVHLFVVNVNDFVIQNYKEVTYAILLHCALANGAVYCNRSCLCVGLCVGLWLFVCL